MKISKRCIVALIVFAIFTQYVWVFEAMANTGRDLQRAREAEEEALYRLGEARQQLVQAGGELQAVLDHIHRIDTEISILQVLLAELQDDIDSLEDSIMFTLGQISETEQELEATRQLLDSQNAMLRERVRAIHENGQMGVLELLLQSGSFMDFLVRLDDLLRVMNFDRELADKIAKTEEAQLGHLDDMSLRLSSLQALVSLRESRIELETEKLYELDDIKLYKAELLDELIENERMLSEMVDLMQEEYYAVARLRGDLQARFDRERAQAEIAAVAQQARIVQPARAASQGTATAGQRGLTPRGQLTAEIIAEYNALIYAAFGTLVLPPLTMISDEERAIRNAGTWARRQRVTQFESELFTWPVPGVQYITGWFGPGHGGIDIMAPAGTRIVAAAAGRVEFSGWTLSHGYLVVIDHENGYTTIYVHNKRNHVSTGQRVERGQHIADVGQTGTTGVDHLHFEITLGGQNIDPMRFFGG